MNAKLRTIKEPRKWYHKNTTVGSEKFSKLNSKNKFLAIASLAVPVITYSFGIINGCADEIRGFDTITRKLLTVYGALTKELTLTDYM